MFQEFPKIARLARECVITEKIDGTNAQLYIASRADALLGLGEHAYDRVTAISADGERFLFAGSRSRYVTPLKDNFGFARWANAHADNLFALGEGRHYGEWWGNGIQRGYGLANGDKRFSLFNVARWADDRDSEKYPAERPACCGVVPVLYRGLFDTVVIDFYLRDLRSHGSRAVPGYMKPEGLVVFHSANGALYKRTLDHDEEPKSLRGTTITVPAVTNPLAVGLQHAGDHL